MVMAGLLWLSLFGQFVAYDRLTEAKRFYRLEHWRNNVRGGFCSRTG
jgi:hypothetical protein